MEFQGWWVGDESLAARHARGGLGTLTLPAEHVC